MKLVVFLFMIVAAMIPAGAASAAAKCSHGYTFSAGACIAIKFPEHAHLNFQGTDWICDYGLQRFNNACVPVIVPRNASLAPDSDVWRCNSGYYEIRGICLPKEVVQVKRAPPLDMKALREVARLRHTDGAYAYIGGVLIFALSMALIAIGILIAGRRREPAALAAALPQTTPSFRPQRAAIGGGWEYWGEQIDGLTGGPIAEGVSVTQCPTCQICYAPESVAVLRRENRGRCLACGNRIQRKPVRLKFETVRDTTLETGDQAALPTGLS